MFRTFAAALIAVNALGVKVQTDSQVHAEAEVLQTSMCEDSLAEFLAKFKTSESADGNRVFKEESWSYNYGSSVSVTFKNIYSGTVLGKT